MPESDENETYTVEWTASDLYALQTILDWAAIEIPDQEYAYAAVSLAKDVNEEVGTEEFNQKIQREHEEAMEEMTPDSPSQTGGGFQ